MARNISLLAAASAPADTDLLWLEQSNVPKKLTLAAVKALGSSTLLAVDDRDIKPNVTPLAKLSAYFASLEGLTGAAGTDYQDLLVLNTYLDSSGGSANALAFDKSEKKIRHYQAAVGTTSWGTPNTLAYLEANKFTGLQQFEHLVQLSPNVTGDVVQTLLNVASYNDDNSSVIGTIKITLPETWSNTMQVYDIRIGEHTTTQGVGHIRLYCYNQTSTSTWSLAQAYVTGINNSELTIRLGHDGTKCCILIGTLSSDWAYPKVVIERVQLNFTAQNNSTWYDKSLWTITRITSEAGITVSATPTIHQPWTNYNHGAGSGLNADLLDGLNSGLNGVNTVLRTDGSGYLVLDTWIRTGAATGFYNTAGNYLYAHSSGWRVRSPTAYGAACALGLERGDTGASLGYVYADANGPAFLNSGGGVRLQARENFTEVTTSSGYIQIGPQNTGFCHIQTDRTQFYFNKRIDVDGLVNIYNTNTVLESTGLTVNHGTNPSGYSPTKHGRLYVTTTSPGADGAAAPANSVDGDTWFIY